MVGSRYLVGAFFGVVALAFFLPVLSHFSGWGLYDWDQHLFYNEAPRLSLLHYGQFPLWNAHYCGGSPLLANPQSGFLSPFFLLVLVFGSVSGLKLQILFFLLFGLSGAFLAARKLRCSVSASVLAGVAFMLSSWFAARVASGHTTFFLFALLPWVFLFYLKSSDDWRWLLACSGVLAVMFLGGGIYPFYASVLLLGVYSVLCAFESRSLRPLLVVGAVFLLVFLLSAVKVLPVLEFAGNVPVAEDTQLMGFGVLSRALLSHSQGLAGNDAATGRDLLEEGREKELAALSGSIPWGWHEYSSHVSFVVLVLAFLSLLAFRFNWKLIFLAVFFLLLGMGDFSPVPVWKLVHALPFFSSLHGPSRFLIPFVFIAALLSARSLSVIKLPYRNVISAAVVLFVSVELLLVSYPLLSSAFPVSPPEGLNTGNPAFIQVYSSAPYISQYPNLLQNLGTVNCYERLHLAAKALPQFVDGVPFPGFIGSAYIAETNASAGFAYFSPNRIVASLSGLNISSASTLVVNGNYYVGWYARNKDAFSYKGLLAAEVLPSDSEVEFYYLPRSFVAGVLISLASLALVILLCFRASFLRRLIIQQS